MGREPLVTVVVMGVSGVGKSSVARLLAERLGLPFVEGDDLHPEPNRARMTAGLPLDDEHRLPWLRRIAVRIDDQEAAGLSSVITCSALRRSYRDLLREGRPSVRFVHLTAPAELIAGRAGARAHHFMPPSLLDSQLAALEPLQPDEPGVLVDACGPPDEVVTRVLRALGER